MVFVSNSSCVAQDGVEDEASEEERHSKRSSDSLIFLDGLRMMYGGGLTGLLNSTGWFKILFNTQFYFQFVQLLFFHFFPSKFPSNIQPKNALGGHMLLKDAVLDLRKGRRYGVVGRNGAGKTTLMSTIAAGGVSGMTAEVKTLHVKPEAWEKHAKC